MRRSRTKKYPWPGQDLNVPKFSWPFTKCKQLERFGALKLRVSSRRLFSEDALARRFRKWGSVNGLYFADQGVRDRETAVVEPIPSGCDKGIIPGRSCGYGFAWQEPEKTVNLKDLA